MEDTNSLIEQRRQNLAGLNARGVNPFMNSFSPDAHCGTVRTELARWAEWNKSPEPKGEPVGLAEGTRVRLAGRITAHRDMGKSQFLDLRDVSGRIQLWVQPKVLGEDAAEIFKLLDLADFIGIEGTLFITRMGEPSVKVESFTPLGKSLRPPPGKWHGLEDTEIRYRQRYLDLMANEPIKEVFLKRSHILKEIRSFFHLRGYVEVETPMMQAIPGGAAAQPFKTYHNALGCEFYMRIALELYLKRLLVGGVDKVFEIGRNFRNEGLSRRHNPEFTMLEAYEAYGDYATMMETVESLIRHIALTVVGTLKIEHRNAEGEVFKTIDLSHWRRARYKDLVCEKAGDDWFMVSPEERRRRAVEDLKLSGDIAVGYQDFDNVSVKEINELVTNGTFDSDLTGWTLSASTPPTWVSGEMQFNSDGATFSDADQNFTTKIGGVYNIEYIINNILSYYNIIPGYISFTELFEELGISEFYTCPP